VKVGDLVRSATNHHLRIEMVRIGIIIWPWSHMGAIVQWNDGEYNFSSFEDMEVISESR